MERGLLKKTMFAQKSKIEKDIAQLKKFVEEQHFANYGKYAMKLNCLEQQLIDLQELIDICVARNKF